MVETHAVLRQCVRARAALAEMKATSEFLPDPTLLINIMPLLEARASTEIENIVTTTDEIFRSAALETGPRDAATKEALNYRRALHEGFRSMREKPVGIATAEAICSAIKHEEVRIRGDTAAALRNNRTGAIIYTPPRGEEMLRGKLENWARFFHDFGDLDPLVAMAVAHYQFEAIHPFADGNGRTGRILNLLHLVSTGLLDAPILYHSRSIIRRKETYYETLHRVTASGDWEPWLVHMLGIVEESARWTLRKVAAIRDLRRETHEWIKERLPKLLSAELLDVLFHQPYCRIPDLVEAGVAKRQAASSYLRQLASKGLLIEEKVGREKLFVHQRFLDLLLDDPDDGGGQENH